MTDIKYFRSFTILHTKTGLASSDIIIIIIISPRCYKIYWFITLKDLFVSR